MKVVQVTNLHRYGGGEDLVAEATLALLSRKGLRVAALTCDSREMGRGLRGKVRAFLNGLYSPWGCRVMAGAIRAHKPDVVHVHEVYPFFSPWILAVCRQAGVPVVMTCHDFRLTCPTAVHLKNGQVCELCLGGREYWCILQNCRENLLESTAYAARNALARKLRLFHNQVSLFIALTEFARHRLMEAGLEAERIELIPNMVAQPESCPDAAQGEYVAYIGRMSPEKGVDTLLAAARTTGLPLRLAGDYSARPELVSGAPPNAQFLGPLDRAGVVDFYRRARFLVLPSKWFEGCPLVLSEAMSFGLPIIASRIGGLPEIVREGVTGFLFEVGDNAELAGKMKLLWDNPDLCRRMGQAGRNQARQEYSEDTYFDRLLAVYEKAIKGQNGKARN